MFGASIVAFVFFAFVIVVAIMVVVAGIGRAAPVRACFGWGRRIAASLECAIRATRPICRCTTVGIVRARRGSSAPQDVDSARSGGKHSGQQQRAHVAWPCTLGANMRERALAVLRRGRDRAQRGMSITRLLFNPSSCKDGHSSDHRDDGVYRRVPNVYT
jgi:hypothetical protein